MKSHVRRLFILLLVFCGLAGVLTTRLYTVQAASQPYTFKNVRTGGGGGFVVDVIFNPKQRDLIFAKTDIGGVYKWNASTSTWSQLLNFVSADNWNWTGGESVATDPVNPNNLYIAGGTYTNSWAPTNGVIWRSTDQGATFQFTQLPFKMGGNMPGRGMGERLVVDPNKNSILYFGARNGNGLWKSTDSGVTWAKVANFPDTGPFMGNPGDTALNYLNQPVGIPWVIFDPASGTAGNATNTIYVGVAENGSGKANIYRSTDAGVTWAAIPGEPTCTGAAGANVTCSDGISWTAGAANSYSGGGTGYLPHEGKLDSQGTLYVTYSDWEGPYNGGHGAVYKYVPSTNTWTLIDPATPANNWLNIGSQYWGYGGLGVDMLHPGTLVVAAVNSWWPDGMLFRTTDGGTTWKPIWKYPSPVTRQFVMDISNAPWLNEGVTQASDPTPPFKLGWMMEGLNIDPFNSDRMMYGTGETLYGTTNLTAWDTATGIVTLKSTSVGIEETSVLGLISPPTGTPHLISVVGDVGGWVHANLDVAPTQAYAIPIFGTNNSIDFAEGNPNFMVRVGTGNPAPDNNQQPYRGTAFTFDGGNNWFQGNVDPVNGQGAGTVAAAVDASRVLWAGQNFPTSYSTDNGNSWHASTNIPQGSVVASDRVNKNKFYGLGQSKAWTSSDGAVTFTASAASGLPSAGTIKAVFGHEGDIWITGGVQTAGGGSSCSPCGLWHSTDSGATFTKLSNVVSAQAVGFGMAAPGGSGYPSVYIAGTVGTLNTMYRSDDAGASWVQITDAQHMFATIQTITGDPRIYGRVYFGTNGLGIFYGDIAGSTSTSTPTTTATRTNTATSTRTPTATQPTFQPPTNTFTPTVVTSTATRTNTATASRTNTATRTPSRTNTASFTPTGATATPSRTNTASNTPTRTNTPTSSFTPSRTNTATATFTPSATGSSAPGTLKVQLQSGGTDTTQASQFNFKVVNTGTLAQSLVSVRVYLQLDGTQPISKYVMEKYWDQSGIATITGPTLASSSVYYYTVTFGTAALPAGGSWQFNSALHLNDWTTNFSAGNDFWHTGYAVGSLPSAFTDTTFIPAYTGSSLVWGTTP